MAKPRQNNSTSDEGFLGPAETLLKKYILLNILSEDDMVCIQSFVSERTSTRNISIEQRYKITSSLAKSRKWLKVPFRQMTTQDLFMGVDAIQNDSGLDEESIANFVTFLKEISIWLIENEMAAPGLKIDKVNQITIPTSVHGINDVVMTDAASDYNPEGIDSDKSNCDKVNLVTLAKIFQKNKKYDLAQAIAEHCLGDPVYQITCFEILMRCSYYQKDFTTSLEYVDKLIASDPLNVNYSAKKTHILEKIKEMMK